MSINWNDGQYICDMFCEDWPLCWGNRPFVLKLNVSFRLSGGTQRFARSETKRTANPFISFYINISTCYGPFACLLSNDNTLRVPLGTSMSFFRPSWSRWAFSFALKTPSGHPAYPAGRQGLVRLRRIQIPLGTPNDKGLRRIHRNPLSFFLTYS